MSAFILGACATVAVQSSATTQADATGSGPLEDATERPLSSTPGSDAAESPATVLALSEAPTATSPSGAATVTHLARGQNAYLGLLRMAGGAEVPLHRDPTEEFIHVLEGEGIVTIDGAEYPVSPGTTIYMPANAEVGFRGGPEALVALQVFAGPGPADKYEAWEPAK
ncbi:cupin domain-containing protein [Pseudenhygromyxa sp. WMMC2535]|uniref:cupin domain-containing protein n=1 Tax=Pseudenhygromyxa sp. WMMC2535 TaxID=2712867 RepID=UPI00155558F8|nr:cupin domain-containing protein [Pseudenhygromyxa sp. WMMC2535]NVB38845.1 cupin domain-containing protein [Pseudenhygromyxa sp. WMMC2535]